MRDYKILLSWKSEKIAQIARGGGILAMPKRKGVFVGDVFPQKQQTSRKEKNVFERQSLEGIRIISIMQKG